jgi:galactokinase
MVTEEEWAAHGDKLPSDLARRAKHFFDENRRAKDAVRLWRDGDVKSFGVLMNASGASSVENYECGCEEITTLWNIVKATEGVFGARFSGAGFRGCVVALCEPGRAAMDAAERIAGEYARVYPELAGDAPVIVTRPGRGAFILRGEDR